MELRSGGTVSAPVMPSTVLDRREEGEEQSRRKHQHRKRLVACPPLYSTVNGPRFLNAVCRRWKIERLFAWLQNFRRLVVRYERYAENFLGMLQLGCCIILLRYL